MTNQPGYGPTYYLQRPGGQPEGPMDRAAILARSIPGSKVSYGQAWLEISSHPDFADQVAGRCVHSFPGGGQYCIKCGAINPTFRAPDGGQQRTVQANSPNGGVAFLGLVLPGLPHMILGQAGKGFFICVVCIVLSLTVALLPLAALINIVSMIDAYKIAKKLQTGARIDPWEFMP